MGGTKSGGGGTDRRDRARSHPESPGCRQRVSSKARLPARARMRNASIAELDVGQRCVTGIASFRFSVRWARAGKVVLRPLAVLTGFPVRPKLDWLFAKMALGTCNDPELCGVFPPGKKRQEESQIGHERRSHHRAFYPGLPLRDSGVSNLPCLCWTFPRSQISPIRFIFKRPS